MKNIFRHIILFAVVFLSVVCYVQAQTDTTKKTGNVGGDYYGDPFSNPSTKSPMAGELPVDIKVELDSSMRTYTIYQKVGDMDYRPVSTMTFQEFAEWKRKMLMNDYWEEPNPFGDDNDTSSSQPLVKKIEVGDVPVEIRPSGSVTLDFGARWQRVDNPAIPVRQQRSGGFDFDQQIQMNIVGTIGERLKLNANWDTKAAFDFDNTIKIDYKSKNIDIIQSVEAGNISFPLKNSLLRGAQNLFGVKTKMKFGKLGVTALVSQQKGKTETLTIKGGSQSRPFEIKASDYDENRHYFMSHEFKTLFDRAYNVNPITPNNGFKITRVEVYKTNSNTRTVNTRNIVGFVDLGEARQSGIYNSNLITSNNTTNNWSANEGNSLWDQINEDTVFREANNTVTYFEGLGYQNGTDFEVIKSAVQLQENKDFFFHEDLGFISLYSELQPDEGLAIAYEYSINGQNFKVGELKEDYQSFDENSVILLKLIKPQSLRTDLPVWDLMMKNIYSVGSSNMTEEGFQLRIIYKDDQGIDNPSLNEGNITKDIPLVQLFNLDEVNMNGDLIRDGNFDFLDNATVLTRLGKLMFPMREPFGDFVEDSLFDKVTESGLVKKYQFDKLYDDIKKNAQYDFLHDKFILKGSARAGGAGGKTIQLPGINIAEGTVVVSSGSITFSEGVDYAVDYNIGRVTFLNEGIFTSSKEITIQYERADLFNFRTKSLFATRFDYEINKNFNVGATWMYLNERPLLSRVNIGDEPIKNHQFGLDLHMKDKSRIITKMVDALPGISTKEEADVSLDMEVAGLIPGVSKLTQGASYLDDFEGAETPYDLTRSPTKWQISSTPLRIEQDATLNTIDYSSHRAKASWYSIDYSFYFGNSINVPDEDSLLINNYTRGILPQEVAPGRDPQQFNTYENTLDISYYPNRRGAYNYNDDPTEVNSDGTFAKPEEMWGGMSRAISFNTNFEETNIQFLEFWMMNPFLDGTLNTQKEGGELYIDIGNVSEDVIKDNRHAFENGLPDDIDSTDWGVVTTQQFLTNAFDNTDGARADQDVGLDGLKNEDEAQFFNEKYSFLDNLSFLNASALNEIEEDPSSDDFLYYHLGDEDNRSILERYEKFNGLENNSPTNDGSSNLPLSNKTIPDNEDLNQDNTISSNESYYEYHVPIKENMMTAGAHPFITSVLKKSDLLSDVQDQPGMDAVSGEEPVWVQMRIPLRDENQYREIFGNINGFSTMKFIRVYMTGWKEPVVIRLVDFQFVGSQWRFFSDEPSLNDPQSGTTDAVCSSSSFNISTVNVEENGTSTDESSCYVVPEGVRRDLDNTTTFTRQLNEQSMRLCTSDLCDGAGKAVSKTMGVDLLNYKQIRMFIHAESVDPSIEDEDLNAFVRLGSDETQNYYEVEIPLHFSDISSCAEEEVWKSENDLEVNLEDFISLKLERNNLGLDISEEHSAFINGRVLKVRGKPDYSELKVVSIGIKNPRDDGESHSACIWVNELRVFGFNQQMGVATRADFRTTLPGLGNINASTKIVGNNYGGIEDKVNARTRATSIEYGAGGTFNMDKFLPKKLGLKIPVYAAIDKKTVNPKFDPTDKDVILRESIDSYQDETKKDIIDKNAIARTTTKTVQLNNVKKVTVKKDAKKRFYSPDNFVFSAGYTEIKASGINNEDFTFGSNLESHLEQTYTGSAGYRYNIKVKPIEPFKKIKLLKSPVFGLIRSFNFTPLPNSISIVGKLNRYYSQTQLYNDQFTTEGVNPMIQKRFTFDRTHNLRWNLTKSISLGYTSSTNALVDEPIGDRNGDDLNGLTREEYQDSVLSNFLDMGRVKNFSQNVDANYKLPLAKIKLLNWMTASVNYKAGYTWKAAALGLTDTNGYEMGHLMTNNRSLSLNSKLNLVKFYNKIPALKKINSPKRRKPKAPVKKKPDPNDTTQAPKVKKELKGVKTMVRALMMVRNVNFKTSLNEGTVVPGFLLEPTFMGLNNWGDPGVPFILGSQDPNIRYRLAENGNLTRSPTQNSQFLQNKKLNYSIRSTVEPFKNFKLQVDLKRERSTNFAEVFRNDTSFYTTDMEDYRSYSSLRSGSFSTTWLTFRSMGFMDLSGKKSDEIFALFESYRTPIKETLDARNEGIGTYGKNSQDVLIPAFLAAYGGNDFKNKENLMFPKIPLPNWRLNYSGLSKIKAFKKKFSSINLTHSYKSTYTINNYVSSLEYGSDVINPNGDFNSTNEFATDTNGVGNYISQYIINEVMISEKFSPLIGVNMRTKKRMSIKIEYKTERRMTLSMSNSQITEINNKDIVLGFGFRRKGMKFFKLFKLDKDLTYKIDLTLRDTKTQQRLIEGTDKITSGNLNFRLNANVSYAPSKRVNVQAFFERTFNEPRISSSFRRTSTAFGVKLRFSLAE